MRTLLIAGAAVAAMMGAGPASAGERMVTRGPGMHAGGWNGPRPMPQVGGQRGPRWGSKVNGRWWGGANAPGGWSAYHRPARGWVLPTYWNSPRFYVSDWSTYGLSQPQYGYSWVRYYDDAVLVDGRGSVYDSVGGLDWDRYDGGDGYAGDAGYGYDDRVYASGPGYAPAPQPQYQPQYQDNRYYERRDNGLGGAAIGAVAGGVAGNLIGGRGNRLGGTLIGAGVGAAAGYAIDKAEDRGRRAPPPPPAYDGYGASYAQPGYPPVAPAYAPPPPPRGPAYPPPPPPRPYPPAPGGHWVSPDGGTTVVTTGVPYGGSVTTVTVQSAPVITTTTTEIYEDHVTWSRPAPRKVWKAKRKVVCSCR